METNDLNAQENMSDLRNKNNNSETFKNEIFKINLISFEERSLQICLQSENGPCPLIAILNVLLLRDKVKLDNEVEFVTGNEMVNIVANYLMTLNENGDDIDLILQHFEELQTGLIVDVCFSNVTDFKDDSNLYIFKFFDIKLYHGWLMDPQNTPDYDRLRNCSYDQITEELLKERDNVLISPTKNFLEEFLISSQLTYHGLCQLNETMVEGELAVLFQNNHFSVIYKNKSVYSLCTDIGFGNGPGTVWQLLNSTSGDTEFVNDKFEPQTIYNNNSSTVDTDWEFAQKLALDDDYEMARALQEEDERAMSDHHQSEVSTPSTTTTTVTNSASMTAGHKETNAHTPSVDKKASSCIIL